MKICGVCGCNCWYIVFRYILVTHILSISGKLALRVMPQNPGYFQSRLPWIFPGTPLKINGAPGNIQGNLTAEGSINHKLRLVQCYQATSQYPNQDPWCDARPQWVNTLRPRQNGRHLPDDIFKCIFLNRDVWISIKIPVKFVPRGPINNVPAVV